MGLRKYIYILEKDTLYFLENALLKFDANSMNLMKHRILNIKITK